MVRTGCAVPASEVLAMLRPCGDAATDCVACLPPSADTWPQSVPGQMPRESAELLPYAAFVEKYLAANKPVVIEGIGREWRAAADWTLADGSLDWSFLADRFGAATVSCTALPAVAGSHAAPCTPMTVADYAALALRREQCQSQAGLEGVPYIKDWHLTLEYPSYEAYTCPAYFTDDWLNWHYVRKRRDFASTACRATDATTQPEQRPGDEMVDCCALNDPAGAEVEPAPPSDYRFVYVGMRGSCTGLHADILRSYSWSINIAGRKRWKLLPPELTYLAMDRHGRQLAPFLETARVPGWEATFPALDRAEAVALECEQGAFEAIFVPSGWHHTVDNLEDTASINHNWLNGHNAHRSWAFVRDTFRRATELIADCRQTCSSAAEFVGLVQRLLGADIGMDVDEFAQIVLGIAQRELQVLRNSSRATSAAARSDDCQQPSASAHQPLSEEAQCCVCGGAVEHRVPWATFMRWEGGGDTDAADRSGAGHDESCEMVGSSRGAAMQPRASALFCGTCLAVLLRLLSATSVLAGMREFASELCHEECANWDRASEPVAPGVIWPWLQQAVRLQEGVQEFVQGIL